MRISDKSVAIVGAGPAGLMAAEVLITAGIKVDVYDAMPSAGRKFLMAGKGGMNITHAEAFEQFLTRYADHRRDLEASLRDFCPESLCAWVKGLGIDTFVGSSGRVFPTEMKAAPLLRAWLHRLREAGVHFHMRHRWQGWSGGGELSFVNSSGELLIEADATILALGGGSWPQLGSTGSWPPLLAQQGVEVLPLRPANCGFEVAWSEHLRERFAGQPLKAVRLNFTNAHGETFNQTGELMLTDYGLEGGLIYACSALLRDEIAAAGSARIFLDLCPDRDISNIKARLALPRGKASLANHLRKRLNLEGAKSALLREVLTTSAMQNPEILAGTLKALPVTLLATRPLAEAISSAGGVSFRALDAHLMLHQLPGTFCAGEMLDWEAPTGGYLLTACLATGRTAGLGALRWIRQN
ncbi:TIGR03862 family flavoprotein [Methylomonas methanica]|uniref:Uncharacterized flavoprotein, PP_4765 family n=1 Tax=Methylomonas methanica (strain DSM 25384 / MC09) TaxID=857087 RepID=G0A6E6_METMM|nr:TIGR03862 family flavoprotein [Methylomonas methanica]AEG02931.1 uncharacterized flavoprotein, PP_4765 family [Methylomonas methanica MC09]